ncbi:MAG: hypothetical protein AAGA76_01075, partial [Pseudomonadota bacterium]
MWRYVLGFAVISVLTVKGIEQYAAFRGYDVPQTEIQKQSKPVEQASKARIEDTEDDTFDYFGRKARIKMDRSG